MPRRSRDVYRCQENIKMPFQTLVVLFGVFLQIRKHFKKLITQRLMSCAFLRSLGVVLMVSDVSLLLLVGIKCV